MQVFKAYFKVMRGSAVSIAINLGVFIGLAVMFSFIAPETMGRHSRPSRRQWPLLTVTARELWRRE